MTSTDSIMLIVAPILFIFLLYWAVRCFNRLWKRVPVGEYRLWTIQLVFGYGIVFYFENMDGKRGKAQYGLYKKEKRFK